MGEFKNIQLAVQLIGFRPKSSLTAVRRSTTQSNIPKEESYLGLCTGWAQSLYLWVTPGLFADHCCPYPASISFQCVEAFFGIC